MELHKLKIPGEKPTIKIKIRLSLKLCPLHLRTMPPKRNELSAIFPHGSLKSAR
jgi:hypothetical protein